MILKKIKNILKNYDNYKYGFQLNAFGNFTHSTFCGGIGSVLYFILAFAILINQLKLSAERT